jgi:hypothetical protein
MDVLLREDARNLCKQRFQKLVGGVEIRAERTPAGVAHVLPRARSADLRVGALAASDVRAGRAVAPRWEDVPLPSAAQRAI